MHMNESSFHFHQVQRYGCWDFLSWEFCQGQNWVAVGILYPIQTAGNTREQPAVQSAPFL